MPIDMTLRPLVQGRVRKERWGGLYYHRALPCINVINETAYFILARCDGRTSLEQIATDLARAYDASEQQIRNDLISYLAQSVVRGYVKIDGIDPALFKQIPRDLIEQQDKAYLEQVGVIGIGDNVLSAPFKVLIETTHNCNMRCIHCFANAKCAPENPAGYLPGELTTEEWCLVLDKIAAAGVFDVFISGGEPLIRKDIFTIMAHAKSRNLGFCLLSNLTLLDDEKAKKLKELGCYKIEGNLDGPDAESYDAFRGLPGGFDLTVKGIRACQANELPLRLNVTATNRNIFQLKDIVRTAVDLKVRELCVIPLEPGGRARADWGELALSPDRHIELMEYYQEVAGWVAENYADRITYIGPCDFLWDDRSNEVVELIDPNRIMPMCGAGKYHCSIGPTGQVILCPTAGDSIKITPGDVVRGDFVDIWQNADVFKAVRNTDIPGCRDCEYKSCAGGCQVNAYHKYGKIGVFPDTDCRKVYYAKMKKAGVQW